MPPVLPKRSDAPYGKGLIALHNILTRRWHPERLTMSAVPSKRVVATHSPMLRTEMDVRVS